MEHMSVIHKTTCRICKGPDLVKILALGDHPPVDNFLSEKDIAREKRYPLDVFFCRACNLVQLLDVVSPEELFHGDYAYFSSASEPLVRHFEQYASDLRQRFLSDGDLVVDIGSNDGVLLQFLKDYQVLGIEPSENVARAAREKGIETLVAFFNSSLADTIIASHGKAKVITANNVFAHIDDIDEIIRGVRILLADDGVYAFEAHYLLDLIQKKEFDTVYHEHLCYYSVKPLIELFRRFEMDIFDVERQETHGGSIRVYAGKKGAHSIEPSVQTLLQLEKDAGLHDEQTFAGFQKEVESIRAKLLEVVREARTEGKKVIGYGAPAKGNTLLNYCGFTADDIAYITDTTPHKIGLLTPGSHIPVVSPDILKTETPTLILLLAWNYKDYILEKEADVRKRGARFIIPIPRVEIV
ncbi:class I SAM-dependent methyltransferase [Candidatus Parcubacteria bacterium]|nr:MAG: class I SAM-dependent methyltransferase [Candidatus Parcubacteria bacterium]